ncbi:MAG: hypothetical protein JJLCMIEE_01877 [Acidimicrobiales bacterium]|nr:MAG: hypothetical protein EDR02_17040 [Actinomycetota bacterium]MBV6508811.1 hypothetical protein [Acidimicrobiales bacterium]RIK03675.1 MAG: hypothetical protein DCC48_16095 [Acidobacteriota bacterium]
MGDAVDPAGLDLGTEVERLRADNERLRAELAESAGETAAGRSRLRGAFIVVFYLLGLIALIASNLMVWFELTITDTDTYVETVAPLSSDEAVATAVSTKLTNQIFVAADVQGFTEDVLGDELDVLAGPLVGAVQGFVQDKVTEVISSDEFASIWAKANRVAHETLMNLINGSEDTVLQGRDGQVVLDLSELANRALDALEKAGIDLLQNVEAPADLGQIVLVEDAQLGLYQDALSILDALSWLLAVMTIVFLGAALWLSKDRRHSIAVIGVVFAAAALFSALAFRLLRGALLDRIDDEGAREAADSAWDIVLRGLFEQTGALLALGIAVAVFAWVVGPARSAVWVRDKAAVVFGWARGEVVKGPRGKFASWVHEHKRAVEGTAAAIAFAVLILVPKISVGLVIAVGIVLAVVVIATEIVAGPGEPAAGSEGGARREADPETTSI